VQQMVLCVLVLKGTMSEAELHVLRARLQGGILNKARRGELECALPVGLIYDASGRVILDPDAEVQQSVRLLFQTYRRTGSAWATVKSFREQGLQFPRRLRAGTRRGELIWAPLGLSRVLQVLHNPRYAGAFVYGRSRMHKPVNGRITYESLPEDQWSVLLREAHPGYITWEEYQENLRRLRESAQAHGGDRRRSPPREGPALLQGLVLCGVCGRRMTVRYHSQSKGLVPNYVCQRELVDCAEPICQSIPGAGIDQAIGELLLEVVTPLALEVALAVQEELRARAEEADRLRRTRVERARYEAELAERRYLHVDPANRLVADALEADWNAKLRDLLEAHQEYEQQRQTDRLLLNEEQRNRVAALATDFPELWRDARMPDRERKRMTRLLIEDVTLSKGTEILLQVRFKGGANRELRLPLPLQAWKLRQTDEAVVAQIDALLEQHTEGEIAVILNERGYASGSGKVFHTRIISKLRRAYGLKTHYERLREAGLLTKQEMAARLGVSVSTVDIWRKHGLLRAHRYDEKRARLYEDPGPNPPVKSQGQKLRLKDRMKAFMSESTKEV
jgi:Recombinase zinc beta ribbon domain/Recombinase